jgi:hypothetical protein
MEYMGCPSSEVDFAMSLFVMVRQRELELFHIVSGKIDAVAGDDQPIPPYPRHLDISRHLRLVGFLIIDCNFSVTTN